jgi:hypothetical protein
MGHGPWHDRGLRGTPALLSDRPLSRGVMTAWIGAAKPSHSPHPTSAVLHGLWLVCGLRFMKSAGWSDLEDCSNLKNPPRLAQSRRLETPDCLPPVSTQLSPSDRHRHFECPVGRLSAQPVRKWQKSLRIAQSIAKNLAIAL